jgi:hypothetical protein
MLACQNNRTFSKEEIEASKFQDKLNEIKEKSKWLEESLEFEVKLRDILFKTGYNEKRINDSIIAIQDRIYFDTVKRWFNKEKLEWYKEHRKDLVNWPVK